MIGEPRQSRLSSKCFMWPKRDNRAPFVSMRRQGSPTVNDFGYGRSRFERGLRSSLATESHDYKPPCGWPDRNGIRPWLGGGLARTGTLVWDWERPAGAREV